MFYYDYSLLNVYEMLYLGKRATRITKKLGSGIKEKGEENVLYVKSWHSLKDEYQQEWNTQRKGV